MSVVLLTGISGSGKTTALRALEDAGFLCIDNLPVTLLPQAIELSADTSSQALAVVVDVRSHRFIHDAGKVIKELLERGVELQVAFLEAQPQRLIQRFSETRRRHPLADGTDIATAIRNETALLAELRKLADLVIDTTDLTVHELKRLIQTRLARESRKSMDVTITSFGFKYGPLYQADLLFDVRFIKNPFFEAQLRDGTGLDAEVAEFVLRQEKVEEFQTQLTALLQTLIPLYRAEGKSYLTVGIGCTGGKHRSVAIAESLGQSLRALGFELSVEHRERGSWSPTP